jgi:phosphate transport system permease protein
MAADSIDLRRRGGHADRGFRWATLVAAFLVLAVLGLIAIVMTKRAWPVFQLMGLKFFTSDTWAPAEHQFGALAFIYGTLLSSAIAVLIAVPVSLGIALFITQVSPRWLRRPMVYVLDLLAVIPSVVFGLWGLLVFSGQIVHVYNAVHSALGSIPVIGRIFGDPSQSGRAFFTAGVILAIMIIPIITSLSREVIETTPVAEKEGALALGATRWEMIRGSVLPHSKVGLVGAVMLGLGRAMGETIAVALVIGSSAQITANVFASGDSMPAVIANQWGEADTQQKSALIALAVTLFIITIVVNVVANAVVARSNRKSQGVRT